WGDGTVTDENDTNNYSIWSLGKGLFAVKGGYAYTQMPSVGTTYTVSVTVHDLDSNVTRSAQSAATIRSPAALTGYGVNISPAKGSEFNGEVASFIPSDPIATAGQFTATVNWGGDGTQSGPITIVPPTTGNRFSVQGRFTYDRAGAYNIRVTVTHTPSPP